MRRVKMIGTHYVGTLIWENGVMAGVQWDGFAEQETLMLSRLQMI